MEIAATTSEATREPAGLARMGKGAGSGLMLRERVRLDRVRAIGRNSLGKVMRTWIEGLEHVCDNPDHDCLEYRLRCAREIADRCGLPRMKELKAHVEVTEIPLAVFPTVPWPAMATTVEVLEELRDSGDGMHNQSFADREPEQLVADTATESESGKAGTTEGSESA